MKAIVNRKCHVSFFAWTARTRSAIKVLFVLYFVSDPESESESEPESEPIRSPESEPEPESESEQPHHDSPPPVLARVDFQCRTTEKIKIVPFQILSAMSSSSLRENIS